MSQILPDNANLEFLRKQAKELQRTQKVGKLADAQHRLAHDYGFSSWSKLKSHVIEQHLAPAEALSLAVCDSNAQAVTKLLESHPTLRDAIDHPLPNYGFGQQALFAAVQRSDKATIEVLLKWGADINKRTEWWAGGFGVLDECHPGLADFLIHRGARLDVHSAARLGRVEELRQLIARDRDCIRARGGDGQTPLHCASTVEVAEILLSAGAALNETDIDHESTPAQYMLRVEQKRHFPQDRQNVARYLVQRGCKTDLLMAAALGDLSLISKHLEQEPQCIYMRVSEKWFPMRDPRAGGTIYIWKLGKERTPHAVARDFGHEEAFQFLLEHTPGDLKITLACELGDPGTFQEMLAANPGLIRRLSEDDKRKLPDAAQSNNAPAVRLMLEAGWPIDTPGDMGATALHWAGFNGNSEIVRDLSRFGPDLSLKSREYSGTALAWPIFGSGNGWRSEEGDFVGTVRLLLEAGARIPPEAEALEPSDAVLEMLP